MGLLHFEVTNRHQFSFQTIPLEAYMLSNLKRGLRVYKIWNNFSKKLSVRKVARFTSETCAAVGSCFLPEFSPKLLPHQKYNLPVFVKNYRSNFFHTFVLSFLFQKRLRTSSLMLFFKTANYPKQTLVQHIWFVKYAATFKWTLSWAPVCNLVQNLLQI